MFDSLLSASLKVGDISYLERFPKFLLDETELAAVTWITKYTRKFKHTPTVERFKSTEWGIYLTPHLETSPLPDLFEEATQDKQKGYFLQKFHELEAVMDSGDDLPIGTIVQIGRDLASVNVEEDDSLYTVDRDDLYSEEEPDGLQFGYEVLDHATGGIQAGEYALLVARTGVGKTLLTCHFALKWAKEGKKVLVISCEMPTKQIIARLDAMIAGFNPRLLRTKENPALLRVKRKIVDRELKVIQEGGGDIIFPKSRLITVSKLRGLIADRQPDVVVVDGVYLLRSDDMSSSSSDWQRLKAASNELKQICLEEELPIFATSQLKRTGKEDGFSLEDIAYSDSLGQDTDLVLVANRFGGIAAQMTVEILKNRHGDGFGGTVLKTNWEDMTMTEVAWTEAIEAGAEPVVRVMGKAIEPMKVLPGSFVEDDDDVAE